MGDREVSEVIPMNRKIKRVLMIAVLFLISLSLAGYQILTHQYLPVDPEDKSYIDIIIPEQSTASQVAELLYEKDLIQGKKIFLAYCRQSGQDSSLKAGHYQLSRSQSLQEIVQIISKGQVVTLSFTIPEGYTVEQIGSSLVAGGFCTAEEWEQALNQRYDYEFLDQASPQEGKSYLEGFLFPDTYIVSEDTDAEGMIKAMLENFDTLWKEKLAPQAEAKGMSLYETLIIASMIEKEAMVAEERAIIAGVIQNRLDLGMPLQIDATVLYALGRQDKQVVYLDDLQIDSPYNTYKYPGLPPAPISCPGLSALEAALNPAKHDYYYYVARGDGSHEFTKTFSEHQQAISKYAR